MNFQRSLDRKARFMKLVKPWTETALVSTRCVRVDAIWIIKLWSLECARIVDIPGPSRHLGMNDALGIPS